MPVRWDSACNRVDWVDFRVFWKGLDCPMEPKSSPRVPVLGELFCGVLWRLGTLKKEWTTVAGVQLKGFGVYVGGFRWGFSWVVAAEVC